MIAAHHLKIALSMGFVFVNGNIFFHTKSKGVDFLTSEYCTSRSLKTIMTALGGIINKYNCRSFTITNFHRDNEFDKSALKELLEPILIHIYGRKEHVPPGSVVGLHIVASPISTYYFNGSITDRGYSWSTRQFPFQ